MFKREQQALTARSLPSLVIDKLNKCDQVWEETLMALEKEPEADLLEGLHHRQLEMPTLMLNALAPHHSDQIHRRSKAMVSVVLEGQQQNFSKDQPKNGVKDRAIPVAPVKNERDGNGGDCKQWS